MYQYAEMFERMVQ